jgi:hypothetical protein
LVDVKLQPKQQLVLVTGIRRMISILQLPPVTEILETNILSIISQIFRFDDGISEEIRAMKVRL